MLDEWGPFIFVAAVILFFGWFAVGMQWNIRKGHAVLRWLREGLPLIGERTTLRWLGTSVVELKIAKAKNPFRNAETLVVLEPRDVSLLWAYYRSRGRRDLMIFRAQLNTAPGFELEVIDPKAWTTQGIEINVQGKGWQTIQVDGTSTLNAYLSDAASISAAKTLIGQTMNMGGKLVRLSMHRTVPNLEIHWQLPNVNVLPAQEWFRKLRLIGESAMRG